MHREQIEEIAYHIRKTRQAKRMTLRISHNGEVGISIPYYATLQQARQFLRDNLPYVRSKLHTVRQRRQSVTDALQELHCPVRGHWLPVHFTESSPPVLDVQNNTVVIGYPAQETAAAHRREAMRFWYETMIQQANEELPRRTIELAAEVGEKLRRIAIRDQKSRWGSCSVQNRSINLNWRCVLFSEPVRDYLIYHELAHLRHADHSEAFWRLVETWCPAYREAEQWISQNEQRLMTFTRDILSIGS
jgi:predicted metal-dependent hydrolase